MNRQYSRREFIRLGAAALPALAGLGVAASLEGEPEKPGLIEPNPAEQGGYLVPQEYADAMLAAMREGRHTLVGRTVTCSWVENC